MNAASYIKKTDEFLEHQMDELEVHIKNLKELNSMSFVPEVLKKDYDAHCDAQANGIKMTHEVIRRYSSQKDLVSKIEPRTDYKIITKFLSWNNSTLAFEDFSEELIVRLSTFNNDDIVFKVLACTDIKGYELERKKYLKRKIDTKPHKDARKRIVDKGIVTSFRHLSDAEADIIEQELNIGYWEVRVPFDEIESIEKFEPNQAPLVAGYGYISPLFKKEYFHA